MAIDRITTGAVLDGAIQTADIANLAIDDTKLKAGAVTAEKMAVGAAFVTGMIMPYAGPIANQAASPSGWLLCDGSEQSASTYAALKNLLLTTYGAYTNGSGGVGTSHFILPDLRGKVIAALDNMGGGSANTINAITNSSYADTLGGVLGVEEHTLTAAQSGMPSHGHADTLGVNTSGLGVNTSGLGVDISGMSASSTVNSLTVYAASGGGGGEGGNFMNGILYHSQGSSNNGFPQQATTNVQTSGGTYSHTGSISTSLGGSASISGSASVSGSVTDNSGVDASAAHPLTQPTMFMNYIIKT